MFEQLGRIGAAVMLVLMIGGGIWGAIYHQTKLDECHMRIRIGERMVLAEDELFECVTSPKAQCVQESMAATFLRKMRDATDEVCQ